MFNTFIFCKCNIMHNSNTSTEANVVDSPIATSMNDGSPQRILLKYRWAHSSAKVHVGYGFTGSLWYTFLSFLWAAMKCVWCKNHTISQTRGQRPALKSYLQMHYPSHHIFIFICKVVPTGRCPLICSKTGNKNIFIPTLAVLYRYYLLSYRCTPHTVQYIYALLIVDRYKVCNPNVGYSHDNLSKQG